MCILSVENPKFVETETFISVEGSMWTPLRDPLSTEFFTTETRTGGDDAIDLLDRNLRLCQSSLSILRHTGPRHALRIICPEA